MTIIERIKGLTLWKKYGIVLAGAYLCLIVMAIAGSILGIAGEGESNVFGWILIGLLFPSAWLVNAMGIKVVISTSLIPLLFMNLILLYAIGALIGSIAKKLQESNCHED